MKLTPFQMIIMLVILAGILYGTYSATMDQLPDMSGTVVGNTTTGSNLTNNSIGTVYFQDESSNSNVSLIITRDTKIYRETSDNKQLESNMRDLRNGCHIDVFTIGDATNTIPPQIVAERIVVRSNS